MKSQEDIIYNKIIISVLIWLWGTITIKSYNINITQTFIEKINGYQQILSIAYGTDDFLKALRNDSTFNAIILHTEKGLEVHIYLAMSIIIQNFNAKLYDLYFHYKIKDTNEVQDIILNFIFVITNFFLLFISNNMLVVIFKLLTSNPEIVYNLSNIFYFIIFKISNSLIYFLAIVPIAMIIMIFLWLQILLPFLELFVIAIACWIMLYLQLNIPCFVIILFTICVRSVFMLIKFYYVTNN